ncbi:MAG: ligase-associated DNA damage response exonuclease [Verrucomicrobia bacterium]|nr:ligase-associated DNA damage response exonuclease [Verrucomicrobiota bacterium]
MKLLRRDLYIESAAIYIDPPHPVDRAIITHAHSDHAKAGHAHVLATPETIGLMKIRYGEGAARSWQALPYGERVHLGGVDVTLYPAGHILGSAQVVVEANGQRVVVSGDYKRSGDGTCAGFTPVQCDIFVTEATFGLPVFQHPDPRGEMEQLLNSVRAFPDRSHLVGAYPLGKTQRLIRLAREAGYDAPIYLHGALVACCEFYQRNGVKLGELRRATGLPRDALKGCLVLAPPSTLREPWSRRLPDPLLGMASGWMTIKQRVRQLGVELPLVISDHADWNELCLTIRQTGAAEIWVTHGPEEALVHWCQTRGLRAAPLHLQGREDEEGVEE